MPLAHLHVLDHSNWRNFWRLQWAQKTVFNWYWNTELPPTAPLCLRVLVRKDCNVWQATRLCTDYYEKARWWHFHFLAILVTSYLSTVLQFKNCFIASVTCRTLHCALNATHIITPPCRVDCNRFLWIWCSALPATPRHVDLIVLRFYRSDDENICIILSYT